MIDTPEHDKLSKVNHLTQTVGEFLDWLQSEGYTVCEYIHEYREEYIPTRKSTNDLISDFFDIDQVKLENEKLEILEVIRNLNKKDNSE